ncbi:hypothetical protein Sango_0782700 [Sesamum angolense]|uniref:Uncharacterized protein n=1 Tax=Sesamum angolense TaxID=2727404 RepID=A0AAE1X2V1_9LAMI|nr:hypothetical protein Sango_0782700 [Sesamum angolense]
MGKSHPLSTPMVVRSLDVKKDPFRPRESDEELLGPEVPYLSAIGALMYLANHTKPDVTFAVNLLARYSSAPREGIGMELSIYFVILEVRWIWGYSIQKYPIVI